MSSLRRFILGLTLLAFVSSLVLIALRSGIYYNVDRTVRIGTGEHTIQVGYTEEVLLKNQTQTYIGVARCSDDPLSTTLSDCDHGQITMAPGEEYLEQNKGTMIKWWETDRPPRTDTWWFTLLALFLLIAVLSYVFLVLAPQINLQR